MSSVKHSRAKRQWSYLDIELIPKDIVGVYAFWCRDNGRCIYVGMAEDEPVKDRLLAHWKGSHNETLRHWIQEFGDNLDICYKAVDLGRIRRFEDRLIKAWDPEANETQRKT